MKIALIGQPNSGKSTVFNHVAGIKAISSNFPGTTVEFQESAIRIEDQICTCVDLPGIYSLISADMAEEKTLDYLLENRVDAIINVMDASLLARSIELTLQLLDLQIPMVVCLNMIDEASRKGMIIDTERLSQILGVPVVPTQATTGHGLRRLFISALKNSARKPTNNPLLFNADIEKIVHQATYIVEQQCTSFFPVPSRFLALRFLQNDALFIGRVKNMAPQCLAQMTELQKKMKKLHGKDAEEVIDSERHALTLNIFEKVTKVRHTSTGIRERIDEYLMHPYLGYLFLILIFYGFFYLVFRVGRLLEEPLLQFFTHVGDFTITQLALTGLPAQIAQGIIQGFAGGIAIVLPYLTPFLLGISFLEDVGYLPRVAFFMDTFMHRIGLHGKAIIPFVLGYGCNVPAVMATRIMESPRDRLISSVLATLVPCSARTAIILGLVAFFVGPVAAMGIYLLNIFIIAATGKFLTSRLPESSPGLIMEIPVFRLPTLRTLLMKTWLRLREFIVIAWPILIAGSVILSLISYYHLDHVINGLFTPLTAILGLPAVVGTTLIFGLLRKELSLIMLLQALGTVQVTDVLSTQQIIVFTIFVVFYFPCLATLGVLIKEIGLRWAGYTVLMTTSIAIVLALIVRILFEVGSVIPF